MIYLKPPFHLIEGIAVFPDHVNERQFHFLPAMPRLATSTDPETGEEVAALQLLEFRGDAGTGGFLTFEVDLKVDQRQLDAIAAELRQIHRLDDAPILSPVVLEDGSVQLFILGERSPEPPGEQPPGTPPPPDDGDDDDDEERRFVLEIAHAAKPALYGDNQAVFSVELDQDGVQLLKSSLLGEVMPIGIVYSLTFLALRPAFTVRVHADWDRVQRHLSESFSADVFFASVEIDEVIDELIEDKVVTIEVDTFLPEGEDGGSFIGRRDQAVDDFKDMVFETFFEPSLEPVRDEEDTWDKVVHTAERLALLGATGGWGGVAKFGYKKVDATRIDKKTANLVMNERVTVRRSIYPQATMKGLTRFLRDEDGAVDLSRYVRSVTLDDPWFERRTVKAHALVNFAYDQVASLNATLRYGDQPRTMRFTSEADALTESWNSIVDAGAMRRPVDYSYRVSFRDVDTTERPGTLESPALTVEGDEFELAPRNERLYFIDEVDIGVGNLTLFDRFGAVDVEVRYDDEANGIHLAETFVLKRDAPEITWKRFRRSAEADVYELRVVYHALDNRDIVVDWAPTDQERLTIPDPQPLTRSVQVVPAVAWGLVSMVFVELSYRDVANGIAVHKTLSFFDTDADRVPKGFTVNLVDPEQRFVHYSATILLSDNRQIKIPESTTAESVIMIRTDMSGHRVVTVQPEAVDFAAAGILRMEASLRYEDVANQLEFSDVFTFTGANDRRHFEFDYVSPTRPSYQCTTRVVFTSGLVRNRDLGLISNDVVVIPAT